MHFQTAAAAAVALIGTVNAYPRDISASVGATLPRDVTSIVKGKTFDRFVSIWLENTDFNKAAGDRTFTSYPNASKKLILEQQI